MPQQNIFTRAKRIFQNAAQPAQSQNQRPNPTDSANHSQYETDGSSYEMLVVDSPSKAHHQPPQQQQSNPQHDHQPTADKSTADDPPLTPSRHQSSRRKTEPQTPRSERPSRHRQSDSEKTQTEPRTPPPAPREEPQTPSQKLPTALRRIDATPLTIGKSSGYNLRSRTRSQAPPTPQRTPARSQRQKTPARTRSRDVRQAPSAHTTSGVAARPAIISRRQIDESSVITLRTMCRRFGLPTTGNKADLRARAVKEFESRHVLEEHNQPLREEVKQPDDSIVARASGDGRRSSKMVNVDNEENSARVQQVTGYQQEEQKQREEDEETGRQLTTSTIKPAGGAKHLPVEATIPAKSDEPSVHAKSDAPEKDPVQPRHPAECSIANSPARPIARRLDEFAKPTVSSTGIEAKFPESPQPPPLHRTPRVTDPAVAFKNQNRQQAPTESVDARGGALDVASIFQELAAGRRKLTQAEYETVLKSLKDKAPDRPPPLQVPINAAHVSLNTLPSTPFQMFKPPTAKPLPENKRISSPANASTVPPVHIAGSSNKPHAPDLPKPKSTVANVLEKSDDNKRSIQKDACPEPPSRVLQGAEDAAPKIMDIEKPAVTDTACGDIDESLDERLDVQLARKRDEPVGEVIPGSQTEEKLRQGPSKVEPVDKEDKRSSDSITNPQPVPNVTNQISLPTIFTGAVGGPHEGNIVNTSERRPAPEAEEVRHENGQRDEDFSREIEPYKNAPRPSEAKRSGFATPRELVRRFNRFGEGHSVVEDDTKAEDSGDPVTSLLRRNARRSSSGVPLFYSARGPSTAGRSILKSRTASKARENQNRLRRVDGLRNLSGRSSFRVKRPLSASAGALLVDLRRVNASNRPSSERTEQRGSYQAELARRPPPMAASALKILKELEQIQESNRTQSSRKRNVSPPPLPPSVVKRARRSGKFSKVGPSSGHRPSIFDQDNGSLPKSTPKESISSTGRHTPKIPIVAYGAGKKRSKRSRTGADNESVPALDIREKKDTADRGLSVREGERGGGSSPPRTRKRPLQKEHLTFGEIRRGDLNQSIDASPKESTLLLPSDRQGARATAAEVERHDSSIPAFGGTFSSKRLPTFQHIPSGERPTNAGSTADKRKAEDFKTIGQRRNDNEEATTPVQSIFGRSNFIQPLSEKPPALLPVTAAEQQAEEPKGGFRSLGSGGPIEGREEDTTPTQDKQTNSTSWPATKAALTPSDSLAFPAKENMKTMSKETDKSNGESQHKPTSADPLRTKTTFQFGKNGVQAPGFSTYKSFGDSPFATSAFAIPSSKTPPKADEKNQGVKGEGTVSNEPSIIHGTASPFGSFGGTKGAAPAVSAPSKPSNQEDDAARNSSVGSPYANPTQELPSVDILEKPKQSPSFEKSDIGDSASEPPKSTLVPAADAVSLHAEGVMAPRPAKDGSTKSAADPRELPNSTSGSATLLPFKPTFGMPQDKVSDLSTGGESALTNIRDPSADSKPKFVPLETGGKASSTIPPLSVIPKTEKPDVSSQNKDDTPGALNDKTPSLFGSGPFAVPAKDSNSQPTFPLSSAPQVTDGAQSGPFTESKFSSAFSSANSSSMFAFGSSTEKGSTVKPAPSFGGFSDSGAMDKATQNPFTPTTNPTPFTFGSQPSSGPEVTKSSGPAFGLSSGSKADSAFGQSNANTVPAFGSSFGSAPSLFNAGGSNDFAVGSSAQAFSAPTKSATAPLFGNLEIPSTPFGSSSGPGNAPTLGATNATNTASTMFGSATAATSAPAFGGAGVGSFSFANSNVGTFGGNPQQPNPFNQTGNPTGGNPQQPNPFNQTGNPTPSGGAFGAGGFNMGSATRGPPMARRRLRGKRTLR